MSWRERSWELVVSAVSWIIAIVALACLGGFAVVCAGQRWREQQQQKKALKGKRREM